MGTGFPFSSASRCLPSCAPTAHGSGVRAEPPVSFPNFRDPSRPGMLFEVLKCGDIERLVQKRTDTTEESILYYATLEETYDIVKRAHVATGHGGRDRMEKELHKKYDNIPRHAIELYKSLCAECQKKKKRARVKGVVVRPILSNDILSRAQIDLIDMQSLADRGHKWICVYQDHFSKFCILRPLSTKRASEVASHILDIFLAFGAPSILQSDNGAEFTASIITEVAQLWPDLKIVHGKPRQPQSQGSVERANSDIKDMLVAWMSENKTTNWTAGIKFVQFRKNTSHHAGIGRSPFKALFGTEAKIGLRSTTLPDGIIDLIETEEELQKALVEPNEDIDMPQAESQTLGPSVGAMPQVERQTPGPSSVHELQKALVEPNEDIDMPQAESQTPGPSFGAMPQAESQTPGPSFGAMPQAESQTPGLSLGAMPQAERQTPGPSSVHEAALQKHDDTIQESRKRARISQQKQADRMLKRSRIEMIPGEIGQTVLVPIPSVDRGRGDPRNIVGVIVDRDVNENYTIAVRAGFRHYV
ncbi:KRAB-A domain-containing protein 2-like [Littorina saxatilis]|uniref:KRAB-A domain-containing protein 2-like n=1 Tax=Littorina saxatilis TaxID=31220 RepID=UPI0038B4CB35